jgi:uncharacterized protein (TIGR02118 family)
MAPVTALLFCYRLPNVDAEQFRDYIEQTHAPLVKSLLGPKHPLTHTRYYTNKDAGFTVGSPSSEDADLIAVITFESLEAMQESMSARRADGVREIIEADEAKFMDRSKVKVVVVGEKDVGRTMRDY